MNDTADNVSHETTPAAPVEPAPAPAAPPPDPAVAGLQQGISVERSKRQTAESELERANRRIAELENPAPAAPVQPADPTPTAPDPVDFSQVAAEAVDRVLTQREQQQQANAHQAAVRDNSAAFHGERKEAAIERYGEQIDLDQAMDVVGNALGRAGEAGIAVGEKLLASDIGWDVVAATYQDPDLVAKIPGMDGTALAWEFGQIQARIQAQAPANSSPAPEPRRISQAPEPVTPIGSRGQGEQDPDKMTPSQYEAWAKSRRGGSVHPQRSS